MHDKTIICCRFNLTQKKYYLGGASNKKARSLNDVSNCHATLWSKHTLQKKWSFPLRISSVNVTKSLMENFILFAVIPISWTLLTLKWITVQSSVWEIFSVFLLFWNLFHEPLSQWNKQQNMRLKESIHFSCTKLKCNNYRGIFRT